MNHITITSYIIYYTYTAILISYCISSHALRGWAAKLASRRNGISSSSSASSTKHMASFYGWHDLAWSLGPGQKLMLDSKWVELPIFKKNSNGKLNVPNVRFVIYVQYISYNCILIYPQKGSSCFLEVKKQQSDGQLLKITSSKSETSDGRLSEV